jgi:hypothetical protein
MFCRLLTLCLVLGALLTVAAQPLAVSQGAYATSEAKECTVYVTRTGAKYHRSTCSSLRYSRRPMTRSDAIAAGYSACKRCGGSACE